MLALSINHISQDNNGFIWIGSLRGLSKYNGLNSKSINRFNNKNIEFINPSKSIKDALWVCSRKTIFLYDTRTNKVLRKTNVKKANILSAFVDHKDILWIGTNRGIAYFNKSSGKLSWLKTHSDLSHKRIRSLYITPNNEYLWAGTFNKLNRISLSDFKLTIYDLKKDFNPNIANNLITSIQAYAKNNCDSLWIGTQTGLCLFNTQTGTYKAFRTDNSNLKSNLINSITVQEQHIWIGSTMGLYKMNKNTYQMESYFHQALIPTSLGNNYVFNTFLDKNNVLWIGTRNSLCITDTKPIPIKTVIINTTPDRTVAANRISAITFASDSTYWLATNSGVLRYKNKILPAIEDEYSNFKLLATRINDIDYFNNKIYITTSAGINIWDNQTKEMTSLPTGLMTDNKLRYPISLHLIHDNHFWVINHAQNLFQITRDSNKNYNIKQFKTSNNGKLLFEKNGFWMFKNRSLEYFDFVENRITITKSLESFVTNNSKNIASCGDSLIWLGTSKEIIKYDRKTNQLKKISLSLSDLSGLGNLICDKNGNVWGAGAQTVFKLNKKNQIEYFSIKEKSLINRLIFNCCCISMDDKIAFGGYDGFVIFNENLSVNNHHTEQQIKIVDIKIKNKTVPVNKKFEGKVVLRENIAFLDDIILNYSQNSITLDFASLNYSTAEQNKFKYILEGFDTKWQTTSGRHTSINYSNLRPGKYTFKVKGVDNYGNAMNIASKLKLIISPHPLFSNIAIGIYIIITISLIYLFVSFRLRILHSTNEMKIIKLKALHNEEIISTKQRFFTNISHELRTPLSLISGPLTKINQNPDLPISIKKQAQIALQNSNRLQRLVSQILDFRKVESNTIRLRVTRVDNIIPILKNIFTLYQSHAQNIGIEYEFICSESHIATWVDIQRIETCVSNLLSNAFKFTEAPGKISLSIQKVNQTDCDSGALSICVSDSGVGIPPEEQDKVFERFFQSSKNRGKQQGSGIGLSMVKEYIERHSGTIKLQSQLNKGTSFELLIPLGNKHIKEQDKFIRKEETPEIETSIKKELTKTENLHTGQDRKNVLIVEDEPEIIEFIQISLEGKYNFFSAANGQIGLERLKKENIDLVISDVSMPVMDGYEMSRRVKKLYPDIPILMLTAKTLIDDEIKGINCGANCYLPKPFDIGLLEAYIESLLKLNTDRTGNIAIQDITTPQPIKTQSVEEKILLKIVKYVEDHMSDPELDNEQLCADLGFSYSTLYRKIKSTTDMSIAELVRSIKLKRAAQLLKEGNMNVTEVMYAVGFTNISYFSRCFKKEFNVSPSNYLHKI
ncbi:hybrid sensor histidine kinase/response regulator transcription factor [Marinifilum sp.]|uniref:hybrid sensor histidine kinase/response regulator transcription factor n=1 Tax=Marinifilum sp. TaxID=2033137 RepID=UPI003BABA547